MSEIEMAIDAIETAFEQEPILEQGYEFYVVIKESLTTALAALREQAEREKGCEACGLIYAIHAESYGIEDLDCANEPIDNKFCPMCGKAVGNEAIR